MTATTDGTRDPDVVIDVDGVRPKRRIGLLGAIAFTTGSMIGSGIFISPKGALQNTGSIGMSLVVWTFCGGIAMVMGLVYAELGALVPQSGGDYTYINKALGALPAFLAVWVNALISNTGSITLLSLVFADYLCAPIFGQCGAPDAIRKSMAAIMITTLAITNVVSVRFAAWTQMFTTIAKSLALIVISVGGIVYLAKGHTENFKNSFHGTADDVTSYTLAIYKCMWAYSGYKVVAEITEEIIDPRKNTARAIVISVIFVTFIYLTTNIAYLVMLPKTEFLASTSVAYDWGRRAIAPAAILIPISVCCAVYGTGNVSSFTTGRIMFAAARNRHFPEMMSYLHVRTRIPTTSVILTHVIALLMLIPGDVAELLNMMGFVGFFVNGTTSISLIRLRLTSQSSVKTFRSPIIVPIVAVLVSIYMVVSPFVSSPKLEFVYGAGFLALGAVIYVPFVHFQMTLPGFDILTTFIQLSLEANPPIKIQ